MNPPRKLAVLRIEDDRKTQLDRTLPIRDLGMVDRWHNFVEDLCNGRLTVFGSDGRRPLWDDPDILTVDFRFGLDSSSPLFDRTAAADTMAWSHKLNDKNTGVLMGATLQPLLGSRDVPTIALPHSGAPGDVGWDWSTVLLFGQIVALSGLHEGSDGYVEGARKILDTVPSDAGEAITRYIDAYRRVLARRFETTKVNDQGPRLWVHPDQLVVLLSNFDEARDDKDLDDRLNRVGLSFWDRDGFDDAIDVRSLFLDRLVPLPPPSAGFKRAKGDHWGYLKLQDVQMTIHGGKDTVGEVRRYFDALQRSVGVNYPIAGDLVVANTCPDSPPKKFKAGDPPGAKFLGVVFAAAEAQLRKGEGVREQLTRRWDVLSNRGNSECPYDLRKILDSLKAVLGEMNDLAPPRRLGPNGYYPTTERTLLVNNAEIVCSGILHGINALIDSEPERSASKVLKAVLHYGDSKTNSNQRARAVDQLLEYLASLGEVDRGLFSCPETAGNGNASPRYRLYRLAKPGASRGGATVTRKEIAQLLGHKPKEITNQLKRSVEGGGYTRDHKGFTVRLLMGDVPPHLALAAGWYMNTYHSDARLIWPSWCKWAE